MEYNVRITEVREMLVPVEAVSMAEAKRIAERNWRSGEDGIGDSYIQRVTFETLYPDLPLLDSFYAAKSMWDKGQIAAEATKYKMHRSEPEL